MSAVRETSPGDVYLGFQMTVDSTSVRFRWTAPYQYELANAAYHLIGHPERTSHVKGIGTCETYYSLAPGRLNGFFARLEFDDNPPIAYKLGGGLLVLRVPRDLQRQAPASTRNDTIAAIPTPALATMLFTKGGAVSKVAWRASATR